jgi:PiT family inorganic phosphate transporter
MAVGGWLSARRVAETLSHRITTLSRGQGLLANAVGSTLVIGASLLGAPVSTTHVSTGAIFGIGLYGDSDGRVITSVILAWLVTLPVAALLAGLCARLLIS